MRNDDPEYIRDLERSARSMENEIRYLESEISKQNAIIEDLHKSISPTFMGDPLITGKKMKCFCDHNETCSVCVPSLWQKVSSQRKENQ